MGGVVLGIARMNSVDFFEFGIARMNSAKQTATEID